MNRENIKLVRDHIAGLKPERFDMSIYVGARGGDAPDATEVGPYMKDCGTAACIAGWAVALLAPDSEAGAVQETAARLFGLNDQDGDELFVPFRDRRRITTSQAVLTLDHLLNTGEVDWSRAGEP